MIKVESMHNKKSSQKNKTFEFNTIILTFVLFIILIYSIESKKANPSFVGIEVCKKCHGSNAIGNQYKIWASTPHAKAFQILSTQKAEEIGKKEGIENPAANIKCLKCHTTDQGKTESIINEGVGCEACHGPGSIYSEFSNHASLNNRENAYRKAIHLGMHPILGLKGIKARERLCRQCHAENRPCINNAKIKREKKLPLSLIADFVFKHPIR